MSTVRDTAIFKENRTRQVLRPGSSSDLNIAPLKPVLKFNPHPEILRGETMKDRSGDQASGFMNE